MYSVEEQLERWNRPLAPSVVFAKSLRAEGPAATGAVVPGGDPGQQQQQQQPPDPFEGLDVDNLPEEAREKITKLRGEFASLQKDKDALTKEKEGLTVLARTHQSRADQATAKLQKHGLIEDPNQPPDTNTVTEKKVAALTKRFVAVGMEEATAKTLAKMQIEAFAELGPDLLKEVGGALGPTVRNVGEMQVDRMLEAAARTDAYSEVLGDQDVFDGARALLLTMVGQGARVDQPTLETAIKITVGERAMKAPSDQNHNPQPPQQRQVTSVNRGTRFSGGPSAPLQTRQGSQAPVPQNAETAAAGAKIAAMFKKSVGK